MNNDFKNSLIGAVFMLCAAFLYGMSYVAIKFGVNDISALGFTGARNMIGFICVLPIAIISGRKKSTGNDYCGFQIQNLLLPGLLCGALLAVGLNFISIGLRHTNAGKAGFICALYIIAVPIIKRLTGKAIEKKIWACAGIAVVGLYFLCVGSGLSVNSGDLFVFISMFGFAFHLIAVERFSKNVPGIYLSAAQYLVCGLISFVLMFLFEEISLAAFKEAIIPILYSGICATGIGFTLQTVGQSHLPSERAGIILSSESIFSALGGYVFFHEILSGRELIGAIMVMLSILFAQIGFKKAK